ncbi:MAG: hypothetical protein NZL87_10100 [Thermomicrobium sp.]|nr:hypothetical protein [Thermomicrobium sp.]
MDEPDQEFDAVPGPEDRVEHDHLRFPLREETDRRIDGVHDPHGSPPFQDRGEPAAKPAVIVNDQNAPALVHLVLPQSRITLK